MEFIAEQKYLLLSPRKIRPVVYAIKRLTPAYALQVLPQVDKKAALFLSKVIKSAMANAKVKGIGETELIFKEIQIGEGPRLKRGRPVSRGMWHPIKKRMSHIRIILETIEKPVVKSSKPAVNLEKKEVKKLEIDKKKGEVATKKAAPKLKK